MQTGPVTITERQSSSIRRWQKGRKQEREADRQQGGKDAAGIGEGLGKLWPVWEPEASLARRAVARPAICTEAAAL